MPTPRFLLYTTIFLLPLLAAWAPKASAKSCVKWPAVMADGRMETAPQGKSILVEGFDDFTKKPGDGWLKFGLRDYVADLVAASKDARVQAGFTAKHGGGPYDFKVGGTFQHLEGKLRIFIRLSDGKGGALVAQEEVLFAYPGNKDLFTKTAEAILRLMERMGIKRDSSRFDAVRDATSSTKAYESYAKGRDLLETYRVSKLKQARAYFTEAKRIDFRSPLGYEGIIALENFLGLRAKQMGKPYSSYFQRAQAELMSMDRLAKPAPMVFGYLKYKPAKKYRGPSSIQNRFLLGYAAYEEGLAAQRAGKLVQASQAFEQAAKFVPEDAMAWYHLARALSMQGDTEAASKAQAKAIEIDPCLGS